MDNKEYRDNQKQQKKAFKKYRKCMWKVLIGFLFAFVAAFALPKTILPWLFGVLKGFLSEYIAGSIVVWTQVISICAGVLTGFVNSIKAIKAKEDIDKYQGLEEDIVDSLIHEKEELEKKVEGLEKENSKVKEETKTNTKINSFRKVNSSYEEEEEKSKSYTR